MDALRGPLNPSLNYEAGLLIENFAYPPSLGFTYNPPYYEGLAENSGFRKLKDLLTFWIDKNIKIPKWVFPLVEELKDKRGLSIRQGNPHDYANELRRIMDLYNAAWDKNWGFVPVTTAEALEIEKNLRLIVDPDLVVFVQHEQEAIGVGFALPDWNPILRRLDGRIGPLGLLKILLRRRQIRGMRGFIFGVDVHGEHIEAAGGVGGSPLGEVPLGRPNDLALLLEVHGELRRAEGIGAAGLDLDEEQRVPLPPDEIDFARRTGEVLGDNPHPAPLQEHARRRFALAAQGTAAIAHHRRACRGGLPANSRTPAKVKRWMGEGPCLAMAARWSGVPYPLCRANP